MSKNNIKQVTNNKEYLTGNNGIDLASADASREISAMSTSWPLGRASPPVAVKGIGIGSDQETIPAGGVSYARLCLHRRHGVDKHKVNLDCRIGASTQFNRLIFHHTLKSSEFYANLPDNWRDWRSYYQCWQEYQRLSATQEPIWIAKGIDRRGQIKGRIKPGTAMLLYRVDGLFQGQCWIHHEHFHFQFDREPKNGEHYLADSEPIARRVEEWGDNTWV